MTFSEVSCVASGKHSKVLSGQICSMLLDILASDSMNFGKLRKKQIALVSDVLRLISLGERVNFLKNVVEASMKHPPVRFSAFSLALLLSEHFDQNNVCLDAIKVAYQLFLIIS